MGRDAVETSAARGSSRGRPHEAGTQRARPCNGPVERRADESEAQTRYCSEHTCHVRVCPKASRLIPSDTRLPREGRARAAPAARAAGGGGGGSRRRRPVTLPQGPPASRAPGPAPLRRGPARRPFRPPRTRPPCAWGDARAGRAVGVRAAATYHRRREPLPRPAAAAAAA